MKKNDFYTFLLFLILTPTYTSAQTKIDSLKSQLLTIKTETELFNIYIDLAYAYIDFDFYPDSSFKYAELAYIKSKSNKNEKQQAFSLLKMGIATIYQQDYSKSIEYLNTALNISINENYTELQSDVYQNLATNYYYLGNYEKTLEYLTNELNINYKLNNKKKIATTLNNLGIIYKNMDEYEDAIYNYQEALKIEEETGDSSGIARALNNIGNIYFHNRSNYVQALDYYTKAIKIYSVLGPKKNEADLLNNIGLIYQKQENFSDALKKFNQALDIFTSLGMDDRIAETQNYLGVLYSKLGNFQMASDYIKKCYEFYTNIGAKPRIAETLKDQGDIFFEWKKYQEALDAYNKGYELSVELGRKSDIASLYHKISETYAELNNYKKAFDYHVLSTDLNDSIFGEKMNKQIAEIQTLYETEKKDKEISLLNKDKALQDATLKRQNLIITFFIAGFVLVSIFLIMIFRLLRQKQKANIILEEKNEKISLQRDYIFEQNKEITASTEYASRIQTALLPPQELIDKLIPDSFTLFKPRDIVSGDYYWLSQKGGKIISVTADCTGHGVPGAFMSMLGISFLNEIVNLSEIEDLRADIILNDMRALIITSLRQTGEVGESRDGMDMTLCIIDKEKMEVDFAGAYNSLFIIRDNEIIETKADKMPIGIHVKRSDNFTNHIIDLKKGDVLYTFSDGYVDQFGGEDNTKFRKKNFKELLLKIHKEDMSKQKEILDNTIMNWMEGYDQIDDILVSGIRI